MSIADTTVFAHNEKCPVREIGDGLVIMAPSGDMTHSLEDIGAFVWQHIDGTRDFAGLVAAVTEAYAVEPEQAADDLRAFLAELVEAELVLTVD